MRTAYMDRYVMSSLLPDCGRHEAAILSGSLSQDAARLGERHQDLGVVLPARHDQDDRSVAQACRAAYGVWVPARKRL